MPRKSGVKNKKLVVQWVDEEFKLPLKQSLGCRVFRAHSPVVKLEPFLQSPLQRRPALAAKP